MTLLSSALESKETLANNLSSCIDCKNNLESKIKLDSRFSNSNKPSLESMASLAEKELQMNEQRMKAFLANEKDSAYGGLDRKWYSDNCHIVCYNGVELRRRLDFCADLIFLSNEKLQNLVEVRENINNMQLQGLHEVLSGSSNPNTPPSSSGNINKNANGSFFSPAPAPAPAPSPIANALSTFSFGFLGSPSASSSAKTKNSSSSSSSSSSSGKVASDIQQSGEGTFSSRSDVLTDEADDYHSAKSNGNNSSSSGNGKEGKEESEGDVVGRESRESLSTRETLVSRHG